MKKALVSMLVSAALVVSQVVPVMAADSGPLAPGAAAGVQQAQGNGECREGYLDVNGNVSYQCIPVAWIIGGLVVLGIGVWILTQGTSANTLAQATTTTTTPIAPQNH